MAVKLKRKVWFCIMRTIIIIRMIPDSSPWFCRNALHFVRGLCGERARKCLLILIVMPFDQQLVHEFIRSKIQCSEIVFRKKERQEERNVGWWPYEPSFASSLTIFMQRFYEIQTFSMVFGVTPSDAVFHFIQWMSWIIIIFCWTNLWFLVKVFYLSNR